jgi:uncharacterized cupin superfamily protein
MLDGELEIRHADKTHVLEPGDSVYFDASTPHSYRCAGKVPAVAIIVTMHQQHIQPPVVHMRPLGASANAQTAHPAGVKADGGFQRASTQQFPSAPRPAIVLPGNGRS